MNNFAPEFLQIVTKILKLNPIWYEEAERIITVFVSFLSSGTLYKSARFEKSFNFIYSIISIILNNGGL